MTEAEIERRLSGIRTLEELEGFEWGVRMQGVMTDYIRGRIATRRAEIRLGRA